MARRRGNFGSPNMGNVMKKMQQIQKQMEETQEIAEAIMDRLQAKGVLVVLEAEHMCMTMRGVAKPGAVTETYVCLGAIEEGSPLVDRVLAMIHGR